MLYVYAFYMQPDFLESASPEQFTGMTLWNIENEQFLQNVNHNPMCLLAKSSRGPDFAPNTPSYDARTHLLE